MPLCTYEKIENMGADVFCRKSREKCDRYLYQTPSHELTCLFYPLTSRQMRQTFSKAAIQTCFDELPVTDFLSFIQLVDPVDLPFFFTTNQFYEKWDELSASTLCCDFERCMEHLLRLIDMKFVDHQRLLGLFRHHDVAIISSLYPTHPMCSIFFEPIVSSVTASLTMFPRDMVQDIIQYLFVPYRKK